MPLAGPYLYVDQLGAPPVRVRISYVKGPGFVCFLDGEDTEMMLDDVPDIDKWREHFTRPE